MRPQRLTLRSSGDRKPRSACFTVSTMARTELTVMAPDWLSVELGGEPRGGVNGTHRLYSLTTKGSLPSGQREGEVVIVMEGRPECVARVPVTTSWMALEVWPRECFLGFVRLGERVQKEFHVRSTRGLPLTVRPASAGGPALCVGEPISVADGEWALTIEFSGDQPGVLDTRFVLEVGAPGGGTVDLPVWAYVVPR